MSDPPQVIAKNLARVAIGDLKPYPRNPRRGNVEAIRESIRTNGYFKPILAQRSTSTIIAGHHAWLAAIEEGIASVPVIWLDVDDDTALRIMLADNRISDLAEYDSAELASLLEAMEELTGTGFSDDDFSELLDHLAPPIPPDRFPEVDPDTLVIDYHCPSCGYEWSGRPNPNTLLK